MTDASFVILASGRGSNALAIADSIDRKEIAARLLAVVSDQPEAPVLERMRKRGVRTLVVPAAGLSRAEHDQKLLAELKALAPRFLVMAGYMRIVSPALIEAFRSERGYSRIVNIHPSLLPAFPGLKSYEQAFQYGAKVAGASVHLVEAQVDSGPICAQEAFSIADCRDPGEVEARGLKIEHALYPRALGWILSENFNVRTTEMDGRRRLCVLPH